MSLSSKNKLMHVKEEIFFLGKQKIEILECLREDEAVHSVLMLQRPHVLHYSIAAGHPGPSVLLQSIQHFLTNLQVVRVLLEDQFYTT